VRILFRVTLVVAAVALLVTPSDGWVRLHTSGGVPYFWAKNKLPLSYVINDQGSDDIPGDAEDVAMRRGFAAWEGLPDSTIAFAEDTSPNAKARTDWEADSLHLVLYDEDGTSGFFPQGFGVVAVTPLQFEVATGKLIDADILFNGRDFHFSADLDSLTFDVRGVGTHEIGHFIGIGHSQTLGASMAPFTGLANYAPRTVHPDDAAAAAELYPGDPVGSISGTVTLGVGGSALSGAHVWARSMDTGLVVSGGYSVDGAFSITGLPPGDYAVTAAPVGEPLDPADMHGSPAAAGVPDGFDTNFSAGTLSPVTVVGVSDTNVGAIALAGDTSLQITAPQISVTVTRGLPSSFIDVQVTEADTVVAADIPGSGIAFELVTPLNPQVVRVQFSVQPDAPLGLHDLILLGDNGRQSVMNGFFEVVPVPLELGTATPDCGPSSGGTLVTVDGEDLGDLAEVILGDTVVTVDSVAPDGMSFQFTSPALEPGEYELAASDASGNEDRTTFEIVEGDPPLLDGLFPAAGSVAGGTTLALFGSGFDADTVVQVDGTEATILEQTEQRIDIVTPVGVAGSVDVAVVHGCCENLRAELASAFTYVALDDPVITAVDPVLLSRDGAQAMTVSGTGFDGTAVVELFVDESDGSGGTVLPTVPGVGNLDVVTPEGPLPVGDTGLLVRRADGAAAVLEGGIEVAPLVNAGLRLEGNLDGAGDTDSAIFDGLAGTKLTLTVKRRGKSDLEPFVTLLGTDGAPLVSSDPASPAFDADVTKTAAKSARLKAFLLPDTGRYTIQAGALAGSGVFRLDVKEGLPKSAKRLTVTKKDGVILGEGEFLTTMDAKAGTLVSGSLKGNKKEGLRPLIMITDPVGSLILLASDCGIAGTDEAMAAVTILAEGRTVKLKKLPLPDFGTYTISITAHEETFGTLTGNLGFRAPKTKGTFEEGL
jgi:hypothetical protein